MEHRTNCIKAVYLLFCIAGAFLCHCQTTSHPVWHDSLNTAKNEDYMTETEKEIIHELNKVRTNPRAYIRYLKEERTYYDGKIRKQAGISLRTNEGLGAVDECIAVLENAAPAGMLYPHENLCKVAGLLAKDQAKTGLTGHTDSKGNSLLKRATRCSISSSLLGENIFYGKHTPRHIVVQLLIDDGVPSRGHRNNIMNVEFNFCGVAIDTHPTFLSVCVMDFGQFNMEKEKNKSDKSNN
ncbi:MAG: CAP domain-containing protein [Prevotellaceae bacterium]|jgi:uncharacterized protein YkwD|nr:CAP domain-containing protein [Prevotellaceae bacterium]